MDGAAAAAVTAPPPGRREQAKSERRGRVVAAACEILREVGVEALSGRAVAARAGVSLSTIYNLFGSKDAVLAQVFDEDLERFEALVAAAHSADALERIFDALDIAADLYQADPGFYRATMLRRPGGGELQTALRAPRIRFWRERVAAAVAEGWLRRETDPVVLSALLIQITGGVLGDWIGGDISVEQLRREIKLGFAVALAAFATPLAASRLRTITAELHRELKASGCRA